MNKFVFCLLAVFGLGSFAQAQDGDKNIVAKELNDGLYALFSQSGGNLGVSVGEDGTFMIDDKFAADGPFLL